MKIPNLWDASVLIDYIAWDVKAKQLQPYLENAHICSINLLEAMSILERQSICLSIETLHICKTLGIHIIAFDQSHLHRASQIHIQTRKERVSYADAACLSLGEQMKAKVLTTDRMWPRLGLKIDIEVIR